MCCTMLQRLSIMVEALMETDHVGSCGEISLAGLESPNVVEDHKDDALGHD